MARKTEGPDRSSGEDAGAVEALRAAVRPADETLPAAREALEASLRAALGACDHEAACLAWSGLVQSRFRQRDFAGDALTDEGLRIACDAFDELPARHRASVAISIAAILSIVRPSDPACDRWERAAAEHAGAAGDAAWLALGMVAAGRAFWTGASIGRFAELAREIDERVAHRRDDDGIAAWQVAKLHCSLLYRAAGLTAPGPLDALGDPPAKQSSALRSDLHAAVRLPWSLTTDRLDEARECFRQIAGIAPDLPDYDAWTLSFYRTWYALASGQDAAAVLEAGRGLALASRSEVAHAIAWARYAVARSQVASVQGRWRLVAEARRAARALGAAPLAALCRLVAGLRAAGQGRRRRAAVLAAAGLRGLEDCGMIHPPLLSAADLRGLSADVAAHARPRGAVPLSDDGVPAQPADAATDAGTLRIYTLGTFSIVRDGAPLGWTRKPPRRPLELLKAIVAMGPRGGAVSRLTGLLWPDLDGDRARQAFASALYRLRRLIGERALVLSEGRLRLDDEHAWVDAFAFEAGVEREGAAALALYGGDFLADETSGWLVSARSRLRDLHRRAVCRAGESLLEEGRWRDALHLYDAALRRDELAEAFYQGALAACRAGGLTAEASELYERCRHTLADQLGLRPSARTQALYQAVVSGS